MDEVGGELVARQRNDRRNQQYLALLGLLGRLTSAFASVDTWNIIGHSDIGTNDDGVLGRKSGDPGLQFQRDRLEAKRFGMVMGATPEATSLSEAAWDSGPAFRK